MNGEAHWYSGHRRVPAREEHREKGLAPREVLSLKVPAWRPLTCAPRRGRDDKLRGSSIIRGSVRRVRAPKQVTPCPRKSTCRLRTAMSRTGVEQFDGCSAAISAGHNVRRRRGGDECGSLLETDKGLAGSQIVTGVLTLLREAGLPSEIPVRKSAARSKRNQVAPGLNALRQG
jgi:hypothetical protein